MKSSFNKSTKRKELNKLSEAKIIKQCKKFNIKIYKLSKKEMVDKLLVKLQAKHKTKQKAKSIKKKQLKRSLIEAYTLVIHSIARKAIQSSQIFPDVIAIQIAQYIELLRIIDTCPDKYQYAIQNYGTFINRKKHKEEDPNRQGRLVVDKMKYPSPIWFGASKGFQMDSNDDNNELVFKIKMHKSNPNDAVGIASRIKICKYGWLNLKRRSISNVSNCDLIMLKNDGTIFNNTARESMKIKPSIAWNDGDVITIRIFTHEVFESDVKFYINDKWYDYGMEISLSSNVKTYYPVLYTSNSGQYQVLL